MNAGCSRFISVAVTDKRLWVRALCLIRGRPIPKVTRDYIVTMDPSGRVRMSECWFGDS